MAPIIAKAALYCADTIIFLKENCYEVDHKWYLRNLLEASKILCK